MLEGVINQKSKCGPYSEKSVLDRRISPKIQKVHFIKMKLTLLFSVRKHPQANKDLVKQFLALSDLPQTLLLGSCSWYINKPFLNLYHFKWGNNAHILGLPSPCRKTHKTSQGDLIKDVDILEIFQHFP